jgi:type I restriction enzyme R subunit
MTGNLGEDPPEWSAKGYLTTKNQREAIKERMKDSADPLQMVIVCDMWLTGTDIPCLHTLYIDKPMEGHNMIQAISRVNRVFSDKPHGLIVDYIGIGDALREATSHYTRKGGGQVDVAPGIEEKARPLFLEALQETRSALPRKDYGGWRRLSEIDLEDLYSLVYGVLASEDDRRDQFLQAEVRLSNAFLLVMSLNDCRKYADEIIFYQRVRKQMLKITAKHPSDRALDHAVQDLVDDSLEPEGVVDIFKAAGITRPDISILDDAFLQTFKDRPIENLQIKLLDRLLADEIERRRGNNVTRARSFKETLEQTLKDYHNRLIDAKEVIEQMIAMKQKMDAEAQRAEQLHLSAEEIAFYDAIAANVVSIYDQAYLCDLIHDVVRTLKRNLKVDWAEAHRADIQADIRAAVKRTLKRRKVREQDLEPFIGSILLQAQALYADWPLVDGDF